MSDVMFSNPIGPDPGGGNLFQQSQSAKATAPITTNPPIPSFLVPVVGFGILLVLANNPIFFKPIVIILVGIIALWLMNG
jgi:hypothetical protein